MPGAQLGLLLVLCGLWATSTATVGRLQLLDYFDLQVDGTSLPLGSAGVEVLAYLGVVGSSSRERIRANLWPDAEQEEALSRLRSLLYRLRHLSAQTAALVEAGPGTVLRLAPDLEVDYQSALRTAAAVQAGADLAPADLAVAVRHLGDDLLPGDTAEWLAPHQRQWSRSRIRCLAVCARTSLAVGDTETAIQAAERVIRSEPYFEDMHEVIVQALADEGFVSSAREAYDRLAVLLRDELDCSPRRTFREVVAATTTSRRLRV